MATSADEIYIQCEPVSDVDNNIVIEEVNQIRIIGGGTFSTDASGQDMDAIEKTFQKSQKNVRKILYTIFCVVGLLMSYKYGFKYYEADDIEPYKRVFVGLLCLLVFLACIIIIPLIWTGVF